MKVLLVNIDSKITNIAIEKIKLFHKLKGDDVFESNEISMFDYSYDKIYVSCVFTRNKYKAEEFKYFLGDKVEIGGTGYDIKKMLPKEIDEMKPKINLGFTTRGCIRDCYFCFVPKKEGNLRVVGDIYDFWDGKSKEITLLDNNILPLREHFKKIYSQLKENNLTVDFNQGLDHRIMTEEQAKMLLDLRHKDFITFAFDDIKYMPTVVKALDILKSLGVKDWQTRWYVYVSPTHNLIDVMDRLMTIRKYKQMAYIMKDVNAKQEWLTTIARYCNFQAAFKLFSIYESKESEFMKPYVDMIDKIIDEYVKLGGKIW